MNLEICEECWTKGRKIEKLEAEARERAALLQTEMTVRVDAQTEIARLNGEVDRLRQEKQALSRNRVVIINVDEGDHYVDEQPPTVSEDFQ